MKFLCDDNLGKLARYLRMMGYDTYFDENMSDAKLLGIMLKEKRIVLTRDSRLIKKIEESRYIFIESDSPESQLKQVIDSLALPIDRDVFFSRCLECNELCEDVSRDEIADKVFPYILKTQKSFKRCPSCGRIYWQGSHYKDMWERLKGIIQ